MKVGVCACGPYLPVRAYVKNLKSAVISLDDFFRCQSPTETDSGAATLLIVYEPWRTKQSRLWRIGAWAQAERICAACACPCHARCNPPLPTRQQQRSRIRIQRTSTRVLGPSTIHHLLLLLPNKVLFRSVLRGSPNATNRDTLLT
jgi:hypothetical protein